MTRPCRRTVLRGSAGFLALTAGCLDSAGLSSPDDGADGTESGDDGDDAETVVELESTDNVAFTHSGVPQEPNAALLESEDLADGWLESHAFDDETVPEFVDETVFGESVLVALEATGSNLCYEMALEDDATEDGSDVRLVLEAAVTDESDGRNCGQQVIAVGQLVRATFVGDPVTNASVTIVDHEGQRHEIGIATESASESSSEADGEEADGEAAEDDGADDS